MYGRLVHSKPIEVCLRFYDVGSCSELGLHAFFEGACRHGGAASDNFARCEVRI
jgi:hypothetical protein